MKTIFVLFLALLSVSKVQALQFNCQSPVIGRFQYKQDQKGFQYLAIKDNQGSTTSLRTDRFPTSGRSQYAYFALNEAVANNYILQVGPAGHANWSSQDLSSVCFAHQPVRGFTMTIDRITGQGTLNLSNLAEVNPRADVKYANVPYARTIESAVLDGVTCPLTSTMDDNNTYPVSCVVK